LKSTKIFLISFILIAIILSILFAYYNLAPKEINVSRDAVIFTENNPSSTINSRIIVSGILSRPLFHQPKFKGNITVDHYALTKDNLMLDIIITEKENGINMGGLVYESSTNPNSTIQEVGRALIWFDDSFQNINIWTTSTWGIQSQKEPNLYIVTGENYNKAIKNQKGMREKFGESFVPG